MSETEPAQSAAVTSAQGLFLNMGFGAFVVSLSFLLFRGGELSLPYSQGLTHLQPMSKNLILSKEVEFGGLKGLLHFKLW